MCILNFAISRDSTNSNHIENLLLTLNQDNEYDAYIVEYGFTKTELETLDQNSLSERDVTLTPIDFDISVFNEDELSQKMIFTSDDGEWGYFCDENLVNVNANCNCVPYYVWETDCYWLPIVNPNSGGGDTQHDNTHNDNSAQNNSNPTNNHGGPTSGSIPHSPNTTVPTNDPCKELKDLLEEPANSNDTTLPNIAPTLALMKTTLNQNGENGAVFRKSPTGDYSTDIQTPTTSAALNLSIGGNIYALVHTHPFISAFPMFSYTDLLRTKELYGANSTAQSEITFLLVNTFNTASTGNVYAIKISDFKAFKLKLRAAEANAINSYPKLNNNSSKKAIYKVLDKQIGMEYKKDESDPEKSFLSLFNNSGIKLYKANDAIDNWTELTLETDFPYDPNGTVVENDCI